MAAPGWLKSFAKKQKIGMEGKSSGALSDAVRESVAVRTPVDVSAVDDYLADELIQVTHTDYSRDQLFIQLFVLCGTAQHVHKYRMTSCMYWK